MLEAEYLERIGAVVYLVGRLEWAVLGDLDRLAARLPNGPTLVDLAGKTSGAIANEFRQAASTDAAVTEWLHIAADRLNKASADRNRVLHARPWAEGLYRWKHGRPSPEAIYITVEWLDDFISKLDEWCCEVEIKRPA